MLQWGVGTVLRGEERVAALRRWCVVLRELSPMAAPRCVYAALPLSPTSPGSPESDWQQLAPVQVSLRSMCQLYFGREDVVVRPVAFK